MSMLWEPLNGLNVSDNYISQKITDRSSHVRGFIASLEGPQAITIAVVSLFILWTLLGTTKKRIAGAKVVGRRGWWEPNLLLSHRFTANTKQILTEGYEKFKDRPFIIKRSDVDFNVLPHKYLDELRLVPSSKLSSIRASTRNLGHKYTFITPMQTSNLHFRVVSNKLTPELHKYLDHMKTELDEIWPDEFPNITDDWQVIDAQENIRRLAARMATKVFVGNPSCREEDWIRISVGFSMDTFNTGTTLRMFPTLLHPIVAWCIPARYRIMENIRTARRFVEPLMTTWKDNVAKKARGEPVEEQDILLNWMLEHGNEKETQVEEMTIRTMFLMLTAVLTTATTTINMLFDLVANPDFIPVLREEIDEITRDLGPMGSSPESSTKKWLARLEKMDSFFVESQRMHVPTLLVPQRLVMEDMKLKDGTFIPKGANITWAGGNHMSDPEVLPNPEEFDPLRSYKTRHTSPDLVSKHLATSVTKDHLAFGYGSQACPGRFFSVVEVKLLLARLISEYDFKFIDGTTKRPAMVYAGENCLSDPTAKIQMRRRQTAST